MPELSLYQPLGNHLAVARNGTTQSQVQLPTEYPVTRIETIADGTINFGKVGYLAAPADGYELQPGDILYSHINSIKHVGKVAQYFGEEKTLYHGMNLLLLRLDGELDKRYFFHYLNGYSARHYAQKECQKAINQVSLNTGQLKKLSVFTPPLPEQSLIARILDTLDTQIQKTEALIAKLEKVKEGLLHDLLTRGIDEKGRLRPSHEQAPELYKESPLGLIPREWRYGPLKNFGQLVSGQHIPGELSNRDGRGVPYFTGPTDFYSGKTVTSSHTEFPQAMCSMGDLLITVKGSGCGKIAISATDACISRQLMAFSFKEAEKGFWRAFFSSNEKMINKIAEGGAIPGISRRQLLHIPAACPKTEYEFIAISEIIVEHEKRQLSEGRQLKKLIKQKSGLMDDLLTGRVRVTPLLEKAQATTPA